MGATWGELAIIWMPHVLALGPLILLAIAMHLLTWEVHSALSAEPCGVLGSEAVDQPVPCLSRKFLGFSVFLAWSIMAMFFEESRILPLQWNLLALGLILAPLLFAC